ncbi:MAG: methyltransferase domain-containing protein [Corynebacteriales bacterium]|nr:methyltransferase domain-containing protein [Mycobacteriales bacterium]
MSEPHRATQLREALVSRLIEDETLRSPEWIAAFRDMPRHVFVPEFYHLELGGRVHAHSMSTNPDIWLNGVYTDTSLLVQYRNGEPTSTSSQPSIMAIMLEALEAQDGDSVLEIGTGSGYNAGLLCHRLGDDNVTSVDIDPALTHDARAHLRTLGYEPLVVTGDGYDGYPPRAPFDRIIATVGVPRLPRAWVEQLAPDGRIVATIGHALMVYRFEQGKLVSHVLPQQAVFLQMRSG